MICAIIEERLEIALDHATDGHGQTLSSMMCITLGERLEILLDHARKRHGRTLSTNFSMELNKSQSSASMITGFPNRRPPKIAKRIRSESISF